MIKLVILPSAERDIAEARAWYEARDLGLGDDFVNRVDSTLEGIRRNPEGHRVVHENYRRALVRRFPYSVFYEFEHDTVVIYAVSHGSVDPRKWRDRLP